MADNYNVLDGTGASLTKAGKDTGSGVQADKVYVLDTALAEPFGNKTDTAYSGNALSGIYAALKGIYNACLAPLSAGTNAIGSITNTAFGISGAVPAGTNTIGAVNLGTLNGAATDTSVQKIAAATDVKSITTSDSVALSPVPKALYVTAGGTLSVKGSSGATVSLGTVAAGQTIPLGPTYVMATGTSATVVGLY